MDGASGCRPNARPLKYCAVSLTDTVSTSRKSARQPSTSRMTTIAPTGNPRYRQGKSDADASARASGRRSSADVSPRTGGRALFQRTIVKMPTPTSAVMRTMSSDTQDTLNASRENAAAVSTAARAAGVSGKVQTARARASAAYSPNATRSSASATTKNTSDEESQTRATARIRRTAPLRTRVTWRRARRATA